MNTRYQAARIGVHKSSSAKRNSSGFSRSAKAMVEFAFVVASMFLIFGKAHAEGEVPTLSDKDALISWVLERFWGHARDATGAIIQPSSELDRQTVPVPTVIAYRVIEAGEISGLAAWCALDWRSNYQSLTSDARLRKMSDKSVAFIGVLHGMAQGIALNSKNSSCSESERQQVVPKLESSTRMGLGATT